MKLNARARKVLFSLVDSYIGSGVPVSSQTVVNRTNLNLSSATVRNILAQLDEMGYLTQPHKSAGRIPTDTGYRFYVNDLIQRLGFSQKSIRGVARRFRLREGRQKLGSLLQETSLILSEVSHYTGLVMAPRIYDVSYNHMEFVRLRENEVMAIFVSNSGIVHSRIVATDQQLTQNELDELTCYLNAELSDLTLEECRDKIVRKMKADRAAYQELLGRVFSMKGPTESDITQDKVYLEGTSNILNHPDIIEDFGRMKKIFEAFDKKNTLVKLLDRSMHSEHVRVYIGSENPLRFLEDCSLVAANYKCKDRIVGSLGIIGPKRMDYSKVIPVVDYTAKWLSKYIEC
jgi:heat-inducible transcriptional repressor